MTSDRHQLAASIRRKALELGFDLVGIAPAEPSKHRDYFRAWLDDGRAATMAYLSARFDERTDPATYLQGCRSIVCVAMNYHTAEPVAGEGEGSAYGRIARYAMGDDYHEVLRPRLHALADWIRAQVPGTDTRCAVDTAPVMEKERAARTSIGWQGKNTCIINEQIGSWLVLGEVLTTLDLPVDEPAIDRCGTCRACIDACPTGAITAPYQLDARRCISYLNIERREPVPAEFHQRLSNWLVGCDICQEVCPWNRRGPASVEPAFRPRFEGGRIRLDEVLAWTEDDYRATLRNSAMKRVKLPVLQRNARLLMERSAGRA